jgi:uncharacterized protein (DUF427 family)
VALFHQSRDHLHICDAWHCGGFSTVRHVRLLSENLQYYYNTPYVYTRVIMARGCLAFRKQKSQSSIEKERQSW